MMVKVIRGGLASRCKESDPGKSVLVAYTSFLIQKLIECFAVRNTP